MSKKNKELPKWFAKEGAIVWNEGATVINPFTGASYKLNKEELSMYDLILGANSIGANALLRKGLDWFRRANPEAYMVLLD
tara:strand:- start:194 stop:436 length:243 start_codon:yes stop_codon:yes gene_type:complete